jgi:phage gp29-like protein
MPGGRPLKPKPVFGESGTIGKITDILNYVQNEVLDRRDVTLEQLIFMTRTDGQARGILNAIKYPIRMARPTIKEAKGGKREAEFVRRNLLGNPSENGMFTPIRVVVARMALAVRDGYKVFEKVWEAKDGNIWLKKLAYRSTLSTKFTYDQNGEITGANQKATFNGKYYDVSWSKDKIAYFLYNAEDNPYMGESDFYPVFYHYDKKHKLYAIAHLAYQLNAVPIRVGKHPAGMIMSDVEKFRAALKSLGTATVMTFPNNCEVDKFESDRKLTEFLNLIQHHDSMMSRVFLTQFMNLGQEGRGGSFALSQDQSNLFLMSLMSFLYDIAEVFNTQIIPQLVDWNFGSRKYPTLQFTPFSDTLRTAIMDTFKSILAARYPQVSSEFVMELEKKIAEELGLEIDYVVVLKRIEEERRSMAEAEKGKTVDTKIVDKADKSKEESDEDLDGQND